MAKTADSQEERWRALMIDAQKGHQKAYQTLLSEVVGAVKGLTARYVFNPSSRDDCVQEVLIAIHKARHTYDPSRAFKPWLFAIVRFRITDHLRAQMRHSKREVYVEEKEFTERPAQEAVVDHSETIVNDAIKLLPKDYREPIRLTKIEGHTTRAAAEMLQISEAALRT